MDKLKNLASGSSGNTAAAPGQQKQDPVDKIFDAGSKKAGHDFSPSTDEKITDAGRGIYEKVTGKKVNPKISN
ncbi:hypothetical protein CPAR01_14218 [Colletotrichum paranaense]|uniref:Uncharacterized protein n=8 Tax=Colletotrichum acutatum species complex TaxID=2707335 RepID=A0A9P7QYK1_9PEZI|nr:uncharacterized protein HER10_EVM0003155 [Colletotrichum scovillei]XP_049149134.1 uncharacterized protein CLUP02_13030 [Colletotrichum lupini]XP_060310302.1 uncharacterized protein CCOS01_11417 [Colletotrichum costaricense]XP_060342530.1 uncharacterized protein CPAR01_14218 [Colletotrichum paranaense]XP_060379405.1 uncharacterized protein CTAM01_09880 [Colletotrichum tamarilloi]XP_060403169.1 uncharacterized protein CABS01_07639 [Colletotrichum abscissum]KAI3531139.1 hypothetical protein C